MIANPLAQWNERERERGTLVRLVDNGHIVAYIITGPQQEGESNK